MIEQVPQELLPHYYDAIKEIYREAFDYSTEQADFLQVRMEQSDNPIVLAVRHNGVVVGFLFGFDFKPENWWAQQLARSLTAEQLAPFYEEAFELNELAVSPRYQAHGYGTMLMQHLFELCAERDILLGTKLENNDHVIRFYRQLNFEDLVNPFYYENNMYGPSLILCRYAK
ncbi:GNAT family N-acetyltransferase [Aerococcaceae bacterium NML180378]|nr:GNAT family N-acetyltransferase [Aerococcaceae bacterium NML171108]MCW6676477.1 GNAT family N-acetyltransferase [Aerococcaceae bacterium NML180378]